MKILFEVGHPAHVYMFRCALTELESHGHEVLIAAISKETTLELLDLEGIGHILIGTNYPSLAAKALTLPLKDLMLIAKSNSWKPDMVVSTGSPYAAQASAVFGIPHIAFSDTDSATSIMRLMLPFTDAVCTPASFTLDLGPKQVRYEGYKELAYLHPNRFRPDPTILGRIGADPKDNLIVVRFGVLNASHDIRSVGLGLNSPRDRLTFVEKLEEYGTVFVTSESTLDTELKKRTPRLQLNEIHQLLCYATLYIGDGATMAAEAGVLGTPWVFVSNVPLGVLSEQESRYGLGFREEGQAAALARAIALLREPGVKAEWQKRRQKMLSEKIDVTEFIVDFIENWPESYDLQKRSRVEASPLNARIKKGR